MAKTQREWIIPAAPPMQRSYRVVAVSMKYQNKKKIGDGYVIADTFKLYYKIVPISFCYLFFYISQIFKNSVWSLEKIHLNMAHYHS